MTPPREACLNGIHDMGGMHGFGPVVAEEGEPVFHEPWEGRVLAMTALALAAGIANGDAFRHAIERLDPVAYLSAGYYGRWLAALGRLLVEAGVVGADELRARVPGLERAWGPVGSASAPGGRSGENAGVGFARRVDHPTRFATGQAVVVRNVHPAGHTRLPGYVRGKRGVVARVHGAFVYPDTNAHGQGEQPQYVYGVGFSARELWGEAAEAPATVHVDLFEPHLEPA